MKRKLTLPLLIIVVLALAIVMPTSAQSGPVELLPAGDAPAGDMMQENTGLWFVEFNSKPLADGGSIADLNSDRVNFNKAAKAARLEYTTRYDFKTLWNGISLQLTKGDAAKLTGVAGVKAIYPVVTIAAPQGEPVLDPDLATALSMTGADIAQNTLGYTGQGVRVAVMDTGVDYDHPDLGGCFGAGCRVAFGTDLVGDAFNADPSSPAYNPVTTPDALPDDCNGHGSHVAGIIGASGDPSTGGARGVAPGVTFGAYRVFGCAGSTTADIMIAAMEAALADDMDVLNMSIGSAFQWPQYPTGEAATRLVNKGVVVVASIGNSGADGLYSAGSPGLGSKVIGVASFDNSHVELATFTVSPDNTPIGYANAAAAPPAPTSGTLPLARTGTPTTNGDGCVNAPAPGSMTGKAVLIRRGSAATTCGFYDKALAAQNAGAAAVILYNNVAGRFSPTVAGAVPITIPVVAISDTEGVLINNRIAAGGATMTWTANTGTFVNPTGGRISSFSSYGLSPDLAFKPRRARWSDPLHLSAGKGRLRHHQRHVDVLPACGGWCCAPA
jgi:minor extracellular serine protease Vpr